MKKMEADKKLEELGIILPQVPKPTQNFVQWVVADRSLFLAGAVPRYNGDDKYLGRVGRDITLAQAYQAARYCTINRLFLDDDGD